MDHLLHIRHDSIAVAGDLRQIVLLDLGIEGEFEHLRVDHDEFQLVGALLI